MTDADRQPAEERVIESMEQSAEVYGLSRSAGRIYGTLYFASQPLSIPELVDRTGYAKSTVSNVTRRLTRIGLIHRRSTGGGGKRVRFDAEETIWYVLQDVLQQHLQRDIQTTLRTIRRAKEQLPDDADRTRTRMETLEETYEHLDEIVRLASEHSMADLHAALESAGR